MPIIASEGEKRFFLVSANTHHAVCFGVWDIGCHKSDYQGQEKIQHKIIVGWEVNEIIPEGEYKGKRACVFKRYTLSLSEKANLRKDLEGWRGKKFTNDELKGFDTEKLLNMNCMLSVVHNEVSGKTYVNVSSVSKLVVGLNKMTPENSSAMPEWIKKVKDSSVQVDSRVLEESEPVEEDDGGEIPF